MAATIVATLGAGAVTIGAGAWLLWGLFNPYACKEALAEIAVASAAIEDLPRDLVKSSTAINDCDSSDNGWVEINAPVEMDVATAVTALEQAGWSRATEGDDMLSQDIDGRDVTATVYDAAHGGGVVTITVDVN